MSLPFIDRIRAGRNATQIIEWPGTSEKVQIRVLARGEFQDANFAAHAHFLSKDVPVVDYTAEIYEEEKIIQLLFRALSETSGKPLFDGVDVFRACVTKDEVDELAAAYALLEDEVSPSSERMSATDYEKFLDVLKKKPQQTIDSVRSIAFARRLLRSLVPPSET